MNEPLHVVQRLSHHLDGPSILVEVDVKDAGHVKEPPDIRIACLPAKTVHRLEQLPVLLVFSISARRYGLHYLGSRAPAIL